MRSDKNVADDLQSLRSWFSLTAAASRKMQEQNGDLVRCHCGHCLNIFWMALSTIC